MELTKALFAPRKMIFFLRSSVAQSAPDMSCLGDQRLPLVEGLSTHTPPYDSRA